MHAADTLASANLPAGTKVMILLLIASIVDIILMYCSPILLARHGADVQHIIWGVGRHSQGILGHGHHSASCLCTVRQHINATVGRAQLYQYHITVMETTQPCSTHTIMGCLRAWTEHPFIPQMDTTRRCLPVHCACSAHNHGVVHKHVKGQP